MTEELREQLKKVFATMHGEELYNVWKKIMSARSYWECFKVYRSFNEFADEALKHWNLKDVFSTYDASTNFNVNSLYFSAYHGKFLSTDNLTIDFPPIAENLNEAIDTIIRFKDDFGFARIKEVLDGTADEGTFLTVKQEVLNVLKELDTKDLIKAYNSYSHFSKADDWFFYVPITNECESFTDLTIRRLLKTLNEWFGTQSAMIKIMEFKKSEKFWISIKNMVKFLNQTDILNINAKSPLL